MKSTFLLCRISDIRLAWRKNRVFFLIAIGCVAFGILLSFRGLKTLSEEKEVVSLAEHISAGEFPFFKIFFYFLLTPSLVCLSIVLFSINYYSNLIYFLELTILFNAVFRNTLAMIYRSILKGLLTFVLVEFPIILYDFFIITYFWTQVFAVVPYPCRKKILHITPYRCILPSVKPVLCKTLCSYALFNVLIVTVFSILFKIIF